MNPRVIISMEEFEAIAKSWKLKTQEGKTAFDVAIENKDKNICTVLRAIAGDPAMEIQFLKIMIDLLKLGANPENILASLEYAEPQLRLAPIGFRIANGYNRRLEYFKLLADCLSEGASAVRIINHLKLTSSSKSQLTLINAIKLKPNDYYDLIRCYLRLIDALLKKNADANTIVKLFNIQTLGGIGLSLEITIHMNILTDLFEKGIAPKTILECLHGKDIQSSLGYLITTCNNGTIYPRNLERAIQEYLALITALLSRNEVNPKEILDFLLSEAKDRFGKATVAYVIAKDHGVATNAFFNLLIALVDRNIEAKTILNMLLYKDERVFPAPGTINHLVIRNHTVEGYFKLLKCMLKKGFSRIEIINLISKDISYIKKNNRYSPEILDLELSRYLLPLLESELLPVEDYLLFTNKDDIFKYTLDLSDDEKHDALRNSLDPSHPRGKFFWQKTGFLSPNLFSGNLRKILEAFLLVAKPDDAGFLLTVLKNILTNERSVSLLHKEENINLILKLLRLIAYLNRPHMNFIASAYDPVISSELMQIRFTLHQLLQSKDIDKSYILQLEDIPIGENTENQQCLLDPSAPSELQLSEINENLINILHRTAFNNNPAVAEKLMQYIEVCLKNKDHDEKFIRSLEAIRKACKGNLKNQLPALSAPSKEQPENIAVTTTVPITSYKSATILSLLSSTSNIKTAVSASGATSEVMQERVTTPEASAPPLDTQEQIVVEPTVQVSSVIVEQVTVPSITSVSVFSTTTTITQTPATMMKETQIPTMEELESRINKLKTAKPVNEPITSRKKEAEPVDDKRKALFG